MDISIIKNAVDNKFIQSIMDVGESQKLEEANVGGESNTSNNIRSTKISWIMDKTILLTLKDKILEINKSKNWNYDITDMFPFQYSVYHENDHYDWHVDVGSIHLGQKERKISFSLILNDNYKGGQFIISDVLYKPEQGSAIIFPSNFMFPHEVKTIKKGTRYSIVTWLM